TASKKYAVDAGLKALQDRYPTSTVEEGLFPTTYRVRHPLPAEPPLVTLIIPTRDGYALVEQAIRTVREKTAYPRYEILIVDNQSTEGRTLQYFEHLQRAGQARVVRYDAPFNFSSINNFGVRETRCEPGWLGNDHVEIT